MPYAENNTYKPPLFLFNRHLETIYPALFRKVEFIKPKRQRLELEDGDFLDIDYFKNNNKRVVIINHGLEGSSDRPYVLGMAKKFYSGSWDVMAWNFRGCSGEINRLPRFYHSGETGDLEKIVEIAAEDYSEILLIGFSLGGNMILKYVGERSTAIHKKIKAALVFSVPVDLESSCKQIMKKENYVYQKRFLDHLKQKVLEKSKAHKNLFALDDIMRIKSIMEFDDKVTAPLHGFESAHDYYEKSSSLQFLNDIKIPVLLVNSTNDPMLSENCYPVRRAQDHDFLHFEKWKYGGHVGYYERGEYYSSENRACDFVAGIGIKE